MLKATRAILEEFQAPEGESTHVIDLAGLQWLRIHVRLPEGVHHWGTCLRCEAGRLASPTGRPTIWWGRQANPRQPFFAFPVPVDRAFRFVPKHPLCVPDPAQGPLEVRGGGEHVVSMIPLPLVRFTLEKPRWSASAGDPPIPRTPSSIPVRLFVPPVLDLPSFSAHAILTPHGYALAGWRPGTYTIQVQLPRSLPVVRSGVEIPREGLDLGALPRRPGSTLRVVTSGPRRTSLRSFRVTSESLPTIARYGKSSPFIAHGLPSGRYLLHYEFADSGDSGTSSVEREIDLDGREDRTVEIHLP